MKKKIGLLVMAYGTPANMDEVESYYTHIRNGRKPSIYQIKDLKKRYKQIGGISPFTKITKTQAKQLVLKLNNWFDNIQFKLYIGFKHASPFIEDAVQQMKIDGIEEAISIILAPHYSTYSLKVYHDRANTISETINGPVIHPIESWYDEPKFISYWVNQIKKTMLMIDEIRKSIVIFSAHSLPEKILLNDDPYPEQINKTAELIAERAHLKNYSIGWQSAGMTEEPWLGPDVQELTKELYNQYGYTSFIYCPIGFVTEHLEVLYDNDYECKAITEMLGVKYFRPKMPNAHSEFIEGLASAVAKKVRKIQKLKLI